MARGKPCSHEEMEEMKKKEAQKRDAVAQSSQCSAESNLSNSEGVELSNQRKDSEHSKAVQAKCHAQK